MFTVQFAVIVEVFIEFDCLRIQNICFGIRHQNVIFFFNG